MQRIGPGSRVGDLEIEEEIGRGAFSRVYRARDTLLGRFVALKVLAADAPLPAAERERLLREARLIGALNSPHVVTIYRVHAADGGGWIYEMEYVDGGTLADRLADPAGLAPETALAILRDVARGLAAAHAAGVVHGDIKPGNVLLGPDATPKLADFGLARLWQEQSLASLEAGPVGTPRYMAPEVVMGEAPLPASDLWSLGVMLFEALAGRHPFAANNLSALFHRVLNAPAPPPPGGLPAELSRLVGRCLEKSPAARPESCAEVVAVLERSGTAAAVREPSPRRRAKPSTWFFGRARERSLLDGLLDRAAAGEGGALLITGEAGLGKSALVRRLAEEARARSCALLEAGVSPIAGLRQSLLEAVRSALSERDLERRLGDSVRLLSEDSHEIGPQFLWALGRLVDELARERPLVICIEDLHHVPREELRVVADLGARARNGPILLATTFRLHDDADSTGSEADPMRYLELAARPEFEHLELEPLAAEEIVRLLEHEHDGVRPAPRVARELTRLAGGNPLFAKELLRHMLDRGAVERRGDRYEQAAAWTEAELPRRLRVLVSRRSLGLDEELRSVLDAAAVDGVRFDGEAIAAVLDLPLLRVLRDLQTLYRERRLVVPREDGYRFAHALVQEVTYEAVAPALRAAIHRRLAEHLERRPEGCDPARLGLHWEQAGEPERARPYLLQAAQLAERRQEIGRTIDLCRRAGLTPDTLDKKTAVEHTDAAMALAACCGDRGDHEAAERIYEVGLAAARAAGEEEIETRYMLQRARVLYPYRDAGIFDEQALLRAERTLGRNRFLGLARYLLGLLERGRGNVEAAGEWFAAAEEAYRDVDALAGVSDALDQRATLIKRQGEPERAEAMYAEAAELSLRAGRRTNAAISEINRALCAFSRGCFAGVHQTLERAVAVLEIEGARQVAAQARLIHAEFALAQGDLAAAEQRCASAAAMLAGSGNLPGELSVHSLKARIAMLRGDFRAAGLETRAARELARRIGRTDTAARIECLEITRLVFAGRVAEACETAKRVLEQTSAESPGRLEPVLEELYECFWVGLPGSLLDAVEQRSGPAGEMQQRCRMLADPGMAPDRLDECAQHLLGPGIGAHRAEAHVLGHWIRAEAHRRRGEPRRARREADEALRRAEKLGHRPHRRRLLEQLSAWTGDPAYAEARRRMEEEA